MLRCRCTRKEEVDVVVRCGREEEVALGEGGTDAGIGRLSVAQPLSRLAVPPLHDEGGRRHQTESCERARAATMATMSKVRCCGPSWTVTSRLGGSVPCDNRAQRAVRGELVAAQVDRAFRLVRIARFLPVAWFERCLISSEKCRISSGITRPAVLAPVKFWIRHDIS